MQHLTIELPLDNDIVVKKERYDDRIFLSGGWKGQVTAGEAILKWWGSSLEIELIEFFDNVLVRKKSCFRPAIYLNFRRKGFATILLHEAISFATKERD